MTGGGRGKTGGMSVDAAPVIPLSGEQHTLEAGDYRAEIAGVGATLRALTFRGRDLVVPFPADQLRPNFRGATLVPWPNRIVDGRYRFAGQDHQAALTEPSRSHALHGLGAWLPWRAVPESTDAAPGGPAIVTLATTIEPQPGYPWRLAVQTRFTLDEDGLTQEVRATNLSAAPAPFGTGPHPYLAVPGALEDAVFELPADLVLETTDDRLIPTELSPVEVDAARFDFRAARPLGAVEIDHAFTGLRAGDDGTVTATLVDAGGIGVALHWDAACPWVQVHTADLPGGAAQPGHRIGLAVEPMTCAPDAFNDDRYPFDTGLRILPPGGSAAASWRLQALG